MRIIDVKELKGGEILAADVMTEDFIVLIGKGSVIKKDYIERLHELNVTLVKIEDESNQDDSFILKKEVEEVCLVKIRDILEHHTYNDNSELVKIENTAQEVIEDIMSDEAVCEKVYELKDRTPDVHEHSLTVCSMATLIAIKLNYDNDTVKDISIASLLHDLGLRYITIPFLNEDVSNLSKKEIEEYKKHTVYGYTAVSHENWISDRAKKILLFHHEKLNGVGYPLHAHVIPEEYQVLGVCETFDELVCGIGCKQIKLSEAVEFMKNIRGKFFDEKVMQAFFELIAIYPVGSKVRLSNGLEAVVISQNKGFPERPVLKNIQTNDIIDLIKTHNIIINELIS